MMTNIATLSHQHVRCPCPSRGVNQTRMASEQSCSGQLRSRWGLERCNLLLFFPFCSKQTFIIKADFFVAFKIANQMVFKIYVCDCCIDNGFVMYVLTTLTTFFIKSTVKLKILNTQKFKYFMCDSTDY